MSKFKNALLLVHFFKKYVLYLVQFYYFCANNFIVKILWKH